MPTTQLDGGGLRTGIDTRLRNEIRAFRPKSYISEPFIHWTYWLNVRLSLWQPSLGSSSCTN